MRILLAALALLAGSASTLSAQLTFSNQSAAAGIDMKYDPGSFASSEYIGPGACGDFDGDGDQDLFLPSGGGSNGPDRLYVNQGDGTFLNQASTWGIAVTHRGTSVAVGDYNADGYLDIYEGSVGTTGGGQSGQNKLYRNVGGASFSQSASAAGVTGLSSDPYGCSFGDFDLDGDLDLFVTGFHSHVNRLFRNNDDGTFTGWTTQAGLTSPLQGVYGFATRFVDTDGDRYPELLVSGDFGTSRYFKNLGNGTFTNFTSASGTGKDENGMGGTIGDFNRDGLIDWYVASIYMDPGNSWTGNKLYHNNGGHTFTEVSAAAGVKDGGYGWGTVGVDFNHDRWLDIAETNGAQWSSEWMNERSYLWLNQGTGTYLEQSAACGFNHFKQGRGMLNFDYDLDGDQDLLIVANDEKTELWRNDLTGADTHWLRVLLDTSAYAVLAPNGYGSVVRVTANGIQQTGSVFGGDNFESQSELTAHFGLGPETIASEVSVTWQDGRVTKLTNVAADQHLTISIDPPFTDVGGGIAGANGPITLSGTGTLMAGAATTLDLTGAVPGAQGILFIGLTALNAPLHGGTFVPFPHFQASITADGSGNYTLASPWPAGLPHAFPIWIQIWLADNTFPHGTAASNGLKLVTP